MGSLLPPLGLVDPSGPAAGWVASCDGRAYDHRDMATSVRGNSTIRARHIAVMVHTGDSTQRAMIPGVFRYAHEAGTWQLSFPDSALGVCAFDSPEQFDGRLISWRSASAVSSGPTILMGSPPLEWTGGVVAIDDEAAGILAAQHLLSLGTKYIGYLGNDQAWSIARTTAFEAEARRQHRSCMGMVSPVRMHPGMDMIQAWIKELLFPIAVLAADDVMALKLAQAAQTLGIHVPEQMAILGINNDELYCSAVVPALSSVAVPWDQIGYEAAHHLDMAMRGKPLPAGVIMRVKPSGIVQRGSTQVLAYGDPLVCDAVRLIRDRASRQAVSVEQLGADLGVSRVQLTQAFLKYAGFSPKQEIDRVRADHLREHLSAGRLPLKRIAYEMGFCSPAELSRFSRRVLGSPPSELRSDRK